MDLIMDNFLKGRKGNRKIVIYQILTRLFGNKKTGKKLFGTIEENGVGKMRDISRAALQEIKKLGITHIWYTGIIEHAVLTDYRKYGIFLDDADIVKGRAGSPYAIKDYYDVNPDLAEYVPDRIKEFRKLIDRTHDVGLKVIIDFVPNHVARQYKSDVKPVEIEDLGENDDIQSAFKPDNNFYYLPGVAFEVPAGYESLGPGNTHPTKDYYFEEVPAKVTGNDVFKAQPDINDWFETVKLNYGLDYMNGGKSYFDPVPATWYKMRDILKYWSGFNVDGFRCDVAEMVPVEFWEWVIPQIKAINPDMIFIAEIYTPSLFRKYIEAGKFDYLYDKVQLYESLKKIIQGRAVTRQISKSLQDQKKVAGHMLRFLENHDEHRLASRFFAGDPFKGLPGMTVASLISTGPVMIYFGQETGEKAEGTSGMSGDDGRTTLFDYWHVPSHQRWMNNGKFDGGLLSVNEKELRNAYMKLLNLCKSCSAICEGAFFDLYNYNLSKGIEHPDKVYYFLRLTLAEKLLVIVNFDKDESFDLKVSLPGEIDGFKLFKKGERIYLHELLHDRFDPDYRIIEKEEIFIQMRISPLASQVFEIRTGL